MDKKEILAKCDHTLLKQTATELDIRKLCVEGIKYGVASVCIPPCYVRLANRCLRDSGVKVCTVVGFPNGYQTLATKCHEAFEAVANGADEIDMVINIGDVKAGQYDFVSAEIRAVKLACNGRPLKVIIETCLLTDEEKVKMCKIINGSGADYIKTSTGFSTGGATFDDIKLFAENVEPHVKIKASGGISSFEDAEKFIELGADRLGTSRLVRIAEEEGLV